MRVLLANRTSGAAQITNTTLSAYSGRHRPKRKMRSSQRLALDYNKTAAPFRRWKLRRLGVAPLPEDVTRWNWSRKVPIIEPQERGIGISGRFVITASHRASYVLAKWCPRAIPCVCVLGYPAERNSLGEPDDRRLFAASVSVLLRTFPVGCPAVLHGHQLVESNGPPTVYVLRDGRDAFVSLYFYLRRSIPGSTLGVGSSSSAGLFSGRRRPGRRVG